MYSLPTKTQNQATTNHITCTSLNISTHADSTLPLKAHKPTNQNTQNQQFSRTTTPPQITQPPKPQNQSKQVKAPIAAISPTGTCPAKSIHNSPGSQIAWKHQLRHLCTPVNLPGAIPHKQAQQLNLQTHLASGNSCAQESSQKPLQLHTNILPLLYIISTLHGRPHPKAHFKIAAKPTKSQPPKCWWHIPRTHQPSKPTKISQNLGKKPAAPIRLITEA
eukprot:gene3438-2389_t